MTSDSTTALLATFMAAHYEVCEPPGSFVVRIGQHSSELARLMREHNVSSIAILTAYNPDAQKANEKNNQAAHEALRATLQQLGLSFLSGKNFDPKGKGPAEPTCVILGIDVRQANSLAHKFRQLAFVIADEAAIPKLVWTSSGTDLEFTA